jgi:hypothetical protein
MILHLAGPGIFVSRLGYSGIVDYILILTFARWLASESVSRIVSRFPTLGPTIYQYSGLFLALVAIPALMFPESLVALYSIPVLIAMFVASHWLLHFGISEARGDGTSVFQSSEVWASFFSAVIVVSITAAFSIEYAAATGAMLSLIICFYQVDVTAEDFERNLAIWRRQADRRARESIANGAMLVRCIAAISFASLTLLRLHIFENPSTIESAIIDLGIILATAEMITYILTKKISYGSERYKRASLGLTTAGFIAMASWNAAPWYIFFAGYLVVTVNSRSFLRTADREFSRAALRGVGNLPGMRELTRYRMMAGIAVLIFVPSVLPAIGIIACLMLLFKTELSHPVEIVGV